MDNGKEVFVNGQQVILNNASGALTPEMCRRAVTLLYGHVEPATVHDGETGYRINKSGARRLTAAEEYDAGVGE